MTKLATADDGTLMIALSVARSSLDYAQRELNKHQAEVDRWKAEVEAERNDLRKITSEIERRDHAVRRT